MKVVYILGQSSHDYAAIRYSIRSVEQYFPQHTGIIIVGERPSWYLGEHYYVPDSNTCPYVNAWHKLVFACSIPTISPIFLYMDDDFYLNAPYQIRHYRKYTSFSHRYQQHRTLPGLWAACIRNTYYVLQADVPDFCLHVPLPIRSKYFLEVTKNYRHIWPLAPSLVPRQVYCTHDDTFDIESMKDVKLRHLHEVEQCSDPFFSTYEEIEGPELFELLSKKYPVPSRYEMQLITH